jgi:glutamyl-tRNA(Gln) amidotransferase subunit E
LNELLSAAESGRFSKEGIPAVLGALFAGSPTLDAALDRAGLTGPGVDDLDAVAERVVRANATMVHERGEAAFSPLMGDVMREVRGRRDGKEVADALRRAISRLGAGNGP